MSQRCCKDLLPDVSFFQPQTPTWSSLATEVVTLGDRYSAEAALKHGIVDRVCTGQQVLQQATALARHAIDKGLPSRHNLHRMKCRIYGNALLGTEFINASKL